MGTINGNESSSLVEYLRNARTTSQFEVDERAAEHGAQYRYNISERHVASAH